MLKQKVSSRIAITIVAGAVILIGSLEWKSLYDRDHPAPRRIDAAYCAACHSTNAGMKMMHWKEGNTGFLFHTKSMLQKAAQASGQSQRSVTSRDLLH